MGGQRTISPDKSGDRVETKLNARVQRRAFTQGSSDLHFPIQRPNWLPSYIPELQGLRGLAVLGVVVYHCHPRLVGTPIYTASLWGWAGVNLFFVLSGFLITSI